MTDHYHWTGRLLDEPDEHEPTGHWPGPWAVDLDDERPNVYANGRVVCFLPSAPTRQEEANARLIAQAPALLDHLARMVIGCPLCSRDVRFLEGRTADGEYCPHCFPARAVLADATGGDW